MVDLDALRLELIAKPEVKSVEYDGDALKVVIRSKIKFYNKEMMLRVLAYKPEYKIINAGICNVEQEHKCFITRESVRRLYHNPGNAFFDPFIDMGSYLLPILEAMRTGDVQLTAHLLVRSTQSFRVDDMVYMKLLYEYMKG